MRSEAITSFWICDFGFRIETRRTTYEIISFEVFSDNLKPVLSFAEGSKTCTVVAHEAE